MSIGQYYRRAALYPMSLIVPAIFFFSIYDNRNYKSEWLTSDAVVWVISIPAFIYCLLIACLGLTIYFVKHNKVKTNRHYLLATWFLLPFGMIVFVLINGLISALSGYVEDKESLPYLLILNLPYLISFPLSLWMFKRDVSQQ